MIVGSLASSSGQLAVNSGNYRCGISSCSVTSSSRTSFAKRRHCLMRHPRVSTKLW